MRVYVFVKANSQKGPYIETISENKYNIYVREVAANGKANIAVIKLIAKLYNVAESNVLIVRGHNIRHKILEISK